MERFVESFRDRITGTLSGFDRMLFRGTLRGLAYPLGMLGWLSAHSVLLKNFGAFANKISTHLKNHAEQLAEAAGRPFEYISSPSLSKEALAESIRQRDGITAGLVCVLSCVEPCQTYEIRSNPNTKHLDLVLATRKCLHLYFYLVDREFGMMHVRLQTWLPMTMQICINGREYLARQLDAAGIGYERRDNCFTRIDNLPAAQRQMDRLTNRKFAKVFNALAKRFNPWLGRPGKLKVNRYYWTVRQGDYATDVMFRHEKSLAEVYPRFVQHAWSCLSTRDVLRFLGRRVRQWVPMRKGLADLPRRVEISRAANKRYLEALAEVQISAKACEVLDPVSRRVTRNGRPHRALRPLSADEAAVFAAMLRGEHAVQGFRNRDIRHALGWDRHRDPEQRAKASARTSRLFALLRSHGLITKVSHTNYYRLTIKGRRVMTTSLKLRQLNLMALAA
ncbi:MAG: hypothetical protein WD875_19385 [Pirellulales bacterium]